MLLNNKKEVILKCIEMVFFTFFFVLSFIFVKESILQYFAKETNIAQSLKPITKLPTVMICFPEDLEYYHDYNETMYIRYDPVELKEDDEDLNYYLKENVPNYFKESQEVVQITRFDLDCLKINSTIKSQSLANSHKVLYIEFSNYDAPKNLDVFFTSEENSYGEYFSVWLDGEPLKTRIHLGKQTNLELTPHEYTYLSDDDQCSQQTFIEQWQPKVLKEDFGNCPRKCLPAQYPIYELPLCWNLTDRLELLMNDEFEAIDCARDVLANSETEFRHGDVYKRPCYFMEYKGEITWIGDIGDEDYYNQSQFEMWLTYSFKAPKMTIAHKEYLLFNTIGLISSVGGTLGLCIGFSFSGVISCLIHLIDKHLLLN